MRNLFSSAKKSNYLSNFILAISMILLTIPGYGQLLQWNTFGNTGTETAEPSVFNATGIAAADLTHGAGVNPTINMHRFGGDQWFDTGNTNPTTLSESIADDDYIEFVVTPSSGYVFTPTAFVFNWDRSGTGPESVTLRSSYDGFTADLGAVTGLPSSLSTGNSIPISGLTNLAVATTFRLYGYGATGTTGSGGFDGTSSIVNVELSGTSSCIVRNVNTSVTYCSLQDAIDNALAGHGLELLADITEGLVQVTEEVTIDGNGFVLTSTSGTYGIEVSSVNVTISDLTIENAGSFGVHANCNSHTLSLTNVTVDNSGGSGVTINGSDDVVITNLTSTNNGGNGLSATNCDNMSVNGITTIGNSFGGGFEAGIGLFTTTAYCLPAEINGFSLTGSVSIDEDTKMYSEKESASDVITGISGSSVSWAVGVGALVRSYWPDKATAYAVVDVSFEPPFNYPNTAIYVAEIATEDFYVDDDPAGDASPPMLIQTSINLQAAGGTVIVEPGTYTENLVVNKALTLHGANVDVDCSSGRGAESILTTSTGSGSQAVSVTADDVTINGFTISNPGGSYGVYTQGRNNLEVLYNIITDIGNNTSGSNASYGIAISMGSAADMDNVLLDNNCVNNIRGGENTSLSGPAAKANNGSAAGIGVGFSTAEYNITNLTVTNNLIDNITACTDDFSDGGKGAYGVLINVGANSAPQYDGQAVSPLVQNNEIDMLAGHWSHGIGLEGETPGAQVKNNIVSNLTDTKGNTDALGVMIEDNDGVGTVEINENSFTSMAFAIRNTEATTVDAECNWYGTAVAMDVAALIDGPVDYISWLTDGIDDQPGIRGFQHPAGCDGAPVILTSAVPSPETCAGGDGSIEVTFSGGTSPFDVSWTGPSSGSDIGVTSPHTITPLSAGIYTVTVTDDNGSTAAATATIEYSPVYNSTALTYHTTIQDAITSASPGDVIEVCAGTYSEDIIVNQSVTIQGPNYMIDPCTGMRGPEAIVVPATAAISSGEIFHVAASNVTITGLTIDGDNPALSSGFTSTNGADIDAAEGITVYETGINGLTVTNNIIQNLSYFGVTLYDYPAGVPSSGHSIANNKIQNLGTYDAGSGIDYWGGGVLLYNNQYAAVTDNCMENVRIGVQTGNFYQANPGGAAYQIISDNTIEARRRGIFHNLAYSSASPITLSNNTITGVVDANETVWDGILLASLSVPSTASNNTIDGTGIANPSEGYEVWNVKSTSPASISGGTVSNVSVGLFVNNYEGYNSNAGDGAHATVTNLSISPKASGTGIRLHDNPLSTNANVQLTIGTGVSVTGGATGLQIENASASIVGGILANLSFTSTSGLYVDLTSNSGDLDGTAVSFDGLTGLSATQFQNFSIEDKINHKIDDGTLGFVMVKAGSDYVTPNSFDAPNTTTPSIQRGIDAASTGEIVNVQTGTYTGMVDAVTGGKDITIVPGASPGCVTIGGDLTLNGGDQLDVEINSTIPCTGYDQLTVNGTVTLGGANLDVTLGYTPSNGDQIVIIENDLADAVVGQFAQGGSITVSGNYFLIDYAGGDGNDVVLTLCAGVTNTTTLEVFCTIQEGVDDPQTLDGHTLAIAAGTYNERVTLSKELTLDGAGAGLTILDGTGLPGNGNGITINSGIENVTIQDLTVRDYTGTNPNSNAGIYGVGGNNNLTVMHVDLADNIGGSGFYANGPVDNVLLDYVDAHGHTNVNGAARGIVIWNGHKSNITITNCEVYNNNCCGIELQDGSSSGVNISDNNVHDNWDNGIGLVGMDETTGANLVDNNTVTDNGRFGIEIKNPNGGGTNTVVSNNAVSQSNSFAVLRPAELRDIAGIAVFRRGLTGSNVDVPTGVTVSGNSVTGYIQDNGASVSEGFGIVIEGTFHTVTGNTLTSNDIGIQQQAGHLPYPGDGDQNNLADNYFGRGNSPTTCGNAFSSNIFSTNGVDERSVGTVGGLVTNTTTLEIFCTIQEGVDDPQTLDGHTLAIAAGTYNERVTLSKELTLDGAGAGLTILDGTGLGGNGNGITINSGIENVTIQDLTVRDYTGTNPNSNAGIYGVGGNNNLTVMHVDLADNIGGSGFYANGPVDNVLLDYVDAHGHTNVNGAARGIVIWNGHKSNITITNCEVYNNNCCGIELQDGSSSGVNISDNNVHDNWDNGIGLVGMDETTGANLVDNNTVTDNGRFGIEIKNPNGGGTNTVVSNNDVSQSNSFAVLRPAELRDIAGIAVFRRGLTGSNVDVPTGVTVSGNSVTGYIQDNGASVSEGFGIVIEGTNHTVTGNTLTSNDIGIQQQAGHLPYPGDGNQNNLADNYFGRGNSPMTCSNDVSSNTFVTNGTDTRNVSTGGGFVTNTTTLEVFCSIQSAIDDANTVNGHTLTIDPGTYNETVVINKELTLTGSGSGSNPLTNTVLVAPVSCTGNAFTISANNVTIQNIYASDYQNGAVLNGVSNATLDQMTLEDYCLYGVSLAGSLNTNVVVTSTVIQRTSFLAGTVGLRAGTANGVNGLLIDECTINGNEFGIYTAQSSATPSLFTDITIQASTISNNLKKGFYFEKLDDALLQELTMDNNGTDATYGFNNGIDINLKYDDYSGITISNCDITNSGVFGTAPDPESPAVITIKARDDAPSYSGNPASLTNVTIQNCLITGPENGIRFGEFGKVNGGPANVTVEGNDLSFAFANKALIRRTDDDVNVVCNWHGSTSLPVILATFADAGTGSTILTSILTSGGDSSGDVGFQPSGSCGCASGNLVTNTNTSETFCTIQAAIDDADTDPGHVLEVGPGTYIEYLYIDKPLDLRGNNFGIDPNTNVRVAESIIIPSYSDPDYTTGGSILYIGSAASGSSVDGFTIDGDNPDLTSAMDINGANIDAVSAVAMYEGAGDLTISNNIAKNVSYSGIELASYPLSLPISTDNVISNNLIDNVGGSPFGIGVIVHYNAYTQIENNVITQVRAGVQTGNFTKLNTGAAATISNNDITSSRRSIFYNVMYNGSSPFTIEDNTLQAEIGSLNSWGLTLGTLGTDVTANILNNTITGHQVGVDFWNNLATTPITVQGGSITNCQVGARANNYDGYNSNAGSASVAISGVTISACDTAVWVKDNPLNTNGATITLTIKDDCEIFNAGQTEKGILVTGPDATVIVQDNDASIHGFAIGIDVNGGNATITNNHIYDNGIGVRFINGGNGDANTNKFYEAGMPNGKDIEVASDAGAVSATPDNWFAGSSFGVDNLSSLAVDATQCYWNDPTGPGPIGPGSGADVSANVLWCPWLGDIPTAFGGTGLPLSSPTVSIVVSETSGLTNDDGTICDGDAVLLDATSPGAVSYLWSTTDVTPSINVSPSTTTIYTVTVTFAGCTDDESVTITVDPLPVLSGPTEVCVGSTIQMLPSSGGTWTSSNDLIATITNAGVVTGESAGSATFTFTNSATGCSSTTASVTVNPVPDATITAPEFAWENTAGYIASVPDAGVGATYAWTLSSGSITMGSGTESITITTGAAGTLTIDVTVTHANGCVTMGTANIEVLPACLMIDFSDPVLLSNTQALGYWYTDRYNPNAFEGQTTAPDATPNTLHVGIDASDGQGSGFYNTQGRKFDLYAGTQAIQADLYIPADWATTNRRMAGLWGTGVDVGSAISAYPIIEFSSDASTPRFRVWESGTGTWVDLGLPAGFVYNNWVTLRIQLLASGEFLYTVLSQQADLQFTTTTSAPDATVEIINTILQGHNTTAGVTYDIYWDNFKSSTILTPTITAPAEVCAGTGGHMASVTPVGGATYNWVVDGGTLTNGQGTTDIEFSAGGGAELTLSVTIVTADCEVTTSATVIVNPLPSAVITTPPTVVESTPNNPATIPDAGGGATYVWAITNGTITNGQGTSSILYTAGSPGVLTLDVTVTDANGCISTGTINVNVIAAGTASMQWVPDDGAHGSCGASTDCCADIICFGLEYTPGVSGNLTTYTTGFITNCLGGFPSGITPINSNMSCVMTDNSFEIDGCSSIDSVLFNSSGNAGSVPVLAGNPIILHKVCFNLSAGDMIGVKEDVITDLSASVDLTGGGQYTEFPTYTTTTLSKTLPVIPPNGASTVNCPADATMPVPPLVLDYCGNTVPATWDSTVDSPDPVTCEGTRTYNFTYTDCANEEYPWSYTYTIEYTSGISAPTNTSETVSCPAEAVNPGPPAIITDACGRTVSPGLIGSNETPNPVTCNGTVIWTYRYTACDGSIADWTHTYTVTYSGGLTAPLDAIETVSCDASAVDPGPPANIFDACGRTVIPGLIGSVEAPNPVTCNGTIIWTYRYTACDDSFVDWTKTYTIDYSGGLTAPANVSETISCDADAVDPGPPASITDACGRTVIPGLIGSLESPNPVVCNGTIIWTYRYTACDAETFVDWTKTYTIDYSEGLTAPANTMSTIECAVDAVDPGPPTDITDACGRTVSADLIGSSAPPACEGSIVWTYRYTACDGTTTTDWTHTYVIDRTTLPSESGGPVEISSIIECPDDALPPTLPVILDVCGTTLSPDGPPVIGGTNTGGCSGTITYTYSYTDCALNQFAWVYTYTVECNALNLKVFLEGPYNTSTDLMKADLNINHVLPGQDKLLSPNPGIQFGAPFTPFGQPYNVAPWNYNGNTGMNFGDPSAPGAPGGVIPYPPDVVDWVLITIRKNGILPANNHWSCAGWVHTDGTISFPEDCGPIGVDPMDDHYILVQHRNHLGVLSPMPIEEYCGGITMNWDFTIGDSYKPVFRYGQAEVEPGKWAMLKANGEQISSINAISSPDRTTWRILQNALGYGIGDYNMNAATTSGDETDWKINQNKTSGIIFY